MTDNQRTVGAGATSGGDDGTIDRSRGTSGLRTGPDASPQELSALAMAGGTPGHTDESTAGVDDKALHGMLPGLDDAELARLSIVEAGMPLDQGSVYVDLNDPGRGPLKALGGQAAEAGTRYVAKRDTDYELWNRLVGQDRNAEIERPEGSER